MFYSARNIKYIGKLIVSRRYHSNQPQIGEREGFLPFPESFETICIHHSIDPSQWKSNAVIPHIVNSTVFKIEDPRQPLEFTYSRFGNPNRSILEKTIAAINKGKYGVCFASGISALMGVLALLKCGDHMICSEDTSPETYEVFHNIGPNYGICATFTDVGDRDKLCSSIQDNTKLIWVENPSNTSLDVTDIRSLAPLAKSKQILLGVDNTILTPYLQTPLELGADIVMQSATKYLNGHSDIIMGCLSTNSGQVQKEVRLMQVEGGLNPSPFECSQTLRGIKTLNLRMDQHLKSATIIANYLGQHPVIGKVIHPGLKSHPHYDIFRTQACGHSGIISFYIVGDSQQSEQFLKGLKLFTVTEVSGGPESTIQIPFSMSHKNWTSALKKKLCINENLIQMSVGLENTCDLILDIESALDSIKNI